MAGVGQSLKSAGGLGIAIFILALVANVFNWIAFTTSSWARQLHNPASLNDLYTGYGLWRICTSGTGVVGACAMVDGTNVGKSYLHFSPLGLAIN